MAKVVITFEDTVGGRFDGSAHVNFEADPPFPVYEDNSPVVEKLTLAQKQALVALGAIDQCFTPLEANLTKLPSPPDAPSPEQVYGD